jgi:glycosyltransferase involved in cell wall biosynthesis
MDILFVTPSYKPAYCYGGPTISVSQLAEALVENGHKVTVYTTTANGEKELDVETGKQVSLNGVSVYYFKRITGDHTHISFALWRRLTKNAGFFDIIHLQSWWSLLILGSAIICVLKRKKYVVSPRGMLSDYTMNTGLSFSKKMLHIIIGKRLLRRSYLHATSSLEWKDFFKINRNVKGFVIHNLVDLPESGMNMAAEKNEVFTIGFLSRIDPKKGLEILFQALSEVSFNYTLKIAGAGEKQYIRSLQFLATKLGISNNITWEGWKGANRKFEFFKSLDLSVLTSYNENFALTIIESLSVGCPVLVSNKVGLEDYVQSNQLGWICKPNPESIRDVINEIYNKRDETDKIREKAPEIVNRDFNRHSLACQYTSNYHRLTGSHPIETVVKVNNRT